MTAHAAGGGRYQRDAAGVWRYAETDEPVPGASDMTISNLYNCRVNAGMVEVPRALAYREAELRWCLAYRPAGDDAHVPTDPDSGRAVIRVPVDEWDRRAREVIGMWAPGLA